MRLSKIVVKTPYEQLMISYRVEDSLVNLKPFLVLIMIWSRFWLLVKLYDIMLAIGEISRRYSYVNRRFDVNITKSQEKSDRRTGQVTSCGVRKYKCIPFNNLLHLSSYLLIGWILFYVMCGSSSALLIGAWLIEVLHKLQRINI